MFSILIITFAAELLTCNSTTTNRMATIDKMLEQISPITLEQMSGVKLMNRTDTKFVTVMPRLLQLLEMARQDYFVQDINGERNMLYDTTYFDTDSFAMYCEHQHGYANRQKIRFRTYVSSHLQFMEIKTKNNHGRTKKKRIEVTDMDLRDNVKRDFIAQRLRFDVDTLQPHMHNFFHRVTLVNSAMTERLTIDTQLEFNNLLTGCTKAMGPLVIIELKRDGRVASPVLEMLRQLHIHPHGFSKYCMGAAMTNSLLPINRFKEKLHYVEKTINTQK